MKSTIRAIFLATFLSAVSGVVAAPPEEAGAGESTWTRADTTLANRYLRLLESRPDYSKVLELLWKLYADHEATELLLKHFEAAASASESSASVRIVYAHLLRRAGDSKRARLYYEGLLDEPSMRSFALLGLANLALEDSEDPEAAEGYFLKLTEANGVNPAVLRGGLMAVAALYLSRSDGESALRTWRRIAVRWPADFGLMQELAARMVNAGYLEEAIEVYNGQRDVQDAELRIAVLLELARLHELANDFEPAAGALNAGRAATHFKHHTHLEFLSMLVRLYERHDRLGELEDLLKSAAEDGSPSERHLFTLVRFYDLTARASELESSLRTLVAAVPGRSEYRRELIEVLISNDKYLEARVFIEELLAEGFPESLSLRLLRVRVELSVGGREAGAALLRDYLAGRELGEPDRGDVLRFAEEHYLDKVAEQLLRDQVEGGQVEAVFRLVDLHHSRGRLKKARRVLDDYVSRGSPDPASKAERLFRSAAAMQGIGLKEAALEALGEAVALQPGSRDYLIRFAEFEAEAKQVDDALEHYEMAWALSGSDDDRTDIDQRIHSLLQLADLQSGARPFGAGASKGVPSRRRSAILNGRDTTAPNNPLRSVRGAIDAGGGESKLMQFYASLRERAANGGGREEQLRTARWANMLEDFAVATELLGALREAHSADLRVERLLLEVAEASKQIPLALRQFELLARMDPEHKIEYELRKAQIRIRQGDEAFREEAFADLEKIANHEDADASLLKRIAGVYGKLGRHEAALEVFRRAFDISTLHEKRGMIAELNRLQAQSGRYEDALEAMTALIREEHDLLQRRKELTSQLNLATQHQLLDKMERDYEVLQRRFPLEPFYSEALALVAENLGKSREAFAAIKRAYYSSRSRDGHLLERMRQLAAKTRDVEAAIYYQKQVVADPASRAEAPEWYKLVRMLEMDLQVAEADRIRVRLESKFAQDPDVLSELADYYLEVRQPASARRVLSRMARLRPWHVTTLMRLGILEKEAGNDDVAAGFLFQALEHTREVAEVGESESVITRFPTRGFSKGARPELSNRKQGLERIVEVLDDTRLIDNRLRVQLAHYFESGRPEYQPVPSDPSLQRLRTIEELGELLARSTDSPLRKRWSDHWGNAPPRSAEEEFWVAWSGGDHEGAWRLLEDHARAVISPVDEFLICLYGTHANRIAELTRWIGESDSLRGERRRRLSWLFAAIYHAAIEGRRLPPEGQLAALLESGFIKSPHLYSMLNLLNKAGLDREAIELGELARSRGVELPIHFDYSLATLAHKAGDFARERGYLETVIDKLDPSGARFQEATVLLFDTLEPGEPRQRLVGEALTVLDQAKENPRAAFGKARLLALSGDSVGAGEALNEVVAMHLAQSKLLHSSLTENFLNSSSQWMSLFDYALSARRLGLAEASREPFEAALRSCDLVVPMDDQAAAYYQHYLFQQVLWAFDGLTFLERGALLQSYRPLLRSEEEWEALARTLAGEGYHRDTISIYGRLLQESPHENDHARAFLNACASALEHEPALDYLNRILAKELPPPEGASGSYFQQQHAFFLAMARDVDRLRAFATQQQLAGPSLSATDRHYHQNLAELLRDRGDLEGALKVFREIEDYSHQHPTVIRKHARLLRDLDRAESAIELLERAIPPGRRAPARPIMEDLAKLYAETGNTEKLRRLTLSSLESVDDELAVEIASSLESAGLDRDAEGVLLFALRRVKSDAARFRLLAPAIAISLNSGSFDRVEPILEILCACDPVEAGDEVGRFLEIIRDYGDKPIALALDTHLARWGNHARSGALVNLLRLQLAYRGGAKSGEAAAIGSRLLRPGTRTNEIAAAVDVCIEGGDVNLAARLMDALEERHQAVDTYAPQAIRFFAAVDDANARARLYDRIVRSRGHRVIPELLTIEIAEAFAECGDDARAAGIFEKITAEPRGQGESAEALKSAHRSFLMDRGRFFEARNLLRSEFRRGNLFDPAAILELYERWGRLENLSAEAASYDLSSGIQLALSDLVAERQKGKEVLSEIPTRQ